MDPNANDVTRLLRRTEEGDAAAADALFELVHGHLHGLAAELMRDERAAHTLQPTALVHEAWLRLMGGAPVQVEDRSHFHRLAARAMRRVLVDHARARQRVKRGEGRTQVSLETVGSADAGADAFDAWQRDGVDVLDLEDALVRLEQHDGELARVVELRFFAGRTLVETAAALATTEEGVRWRWKLAQAWLRRELGRGDAEEGS